LSDGYTYAVNAFDPKINGWQEVLNDENTDNITIANPSASNLIIFASGNNNFNTEMQKANKPSQKTSDGTAEFFEIQQGGFRSVNISNKSVNAFDPKINGWQEVLNDENTDNITIANPSASNLIIFASGNNNFNTEMQKANKPSQKTSKEDFSP
jgi:protein involved in ribonucleotide reduction